MLPVLAGLLLGGLIVVACWDDIVNWLKDLIPKVKAALSGIAHAVKMFGKKVKNAAVHIIHRLFSYITMSFLFRHSPVLDQQTFGLCYISDLAQFFAQAQQHSEPRAGNVLQFLSIKNRLKARIL